MKPHNIARMRMRRQHLWGKPLGSIEDVVAHLGAVQAQEFPLAKWSLAQRTRRADNAAIDRAFAEGIILRTHILRPTWHFVLPVDIRWMLALTAPRIKRLMSFYDGRLSLDPKTITRTNSLLAKAVAAGAHLTRIELGDVLERAEIPALGQRLGHIVMHAELDGILCSGAMRGKKHTYASLDERAPHARALDRDEALAELTRRYFTGHGPATIKDFVWWSSLTTADARQGLEAVSIDLEREEVDGRTYWFASAPPKRTPSARIDLVQVYDESLVAYTESRDAMLGSSTIPVVGARVLHAILLDGRLFGFWRPRPATDGVVLETSTFRRLNADEKKSLTATVERYGKFAGMPARILETELQ